MKSWVFGSRFESAVEVLTEAAVMRTETAKHTEGIRSHAADLYWLAFLLTGRQDISIDIAADTVVSDDHASPFFGEWMRGWTASYRKSSYRNPQ
jgi:hypothetical protein